MQPKILIVTTEAPDVLGGGLGFFNQILWTELKKRNYPFKTLYLNTNHTRTSQRVDYQMQVVEDFPFDASFESVALNKAWSTRQRLQPLMDEYRPDIISLHESWTVLPFYYELHKVQFTLHSGYIGLSHYLSRSQKGLQHYWEQYIALRQSRAVVLHSEWSKRMVQEYIAKDTAPISVFPIGVEPDDYPIEKQPHPQGKIVVSFFGRFVDIIKNFDAFRKAILGLPENYRARIEPRVYGPDQIPPNLAEEGFRCLPFVQGDAKKAAFAQTDIVVVPSQVESFGLVGLEALLSNCALIATPGLAMDFYIPPEAACEPTAEKIRSRLMHDIDHFDLIREKQKNNEYRHAVMRSELNIKSMATEYIKVWENMFSRQGR